MPVPGRITDNDILPVIRTSIVSRLALWQRTIEQCLCRCVHGDGGWFRDGSWSGSSGGCEGHAGEEEGFGDEACCVHDVCCCGLVFVLVWLVVVAMENLSDKIEIVIKLN